MKLDINELREELNILIMQLDNLRLKASDLRRHFKMSYPADICSVFLSRNPDKSLTPLFWRYSSVKRGKKGLRPPAADFWNLIEKMSIEHRIDLTSIELKRIELNFGISVTSYKILRLEKMISDLNKYVKAVRTGDIL